MDWLLVSASIAYWGFLGYLCWRYGLWPFERDLPRQDRRPDVLPAEWVWPPKWKPAASEATCRPLGHEDHFDHREAA